MTFTNRFLTIVALAAVILFGGAMTCTAQTTGGYQQFALYSDFAHYLGLSQTQTDTINKQLLGLNYDWDEVINQIATLDEEITNVENDTTQTPTAIGNTVATLVQQKVTAARQIIAEVQASNKTLLTLLNVSQGLQVGALQNGVQNAYTLLNMNSDAFTSNLTLSQYSVAGLDSDAGSYGVAAALPQTQAAVINQMVVAAVTRAKADRTNARALAARQARMIEQKR